MPGLDFIARKHFGGIVGIPDIDAEWPQPFCAAQGVRRLTIRAADKRQQPFDLVDLGEFDLVKSQENFRYFSTVCWQWKPTILREERTEGTARLLLAQYLDGGFAGPGRPLHPGDTVVLYLTGIGKTATTFAEGAAPKTTSKALESIQILVQGQAAQVLYAGVQPQFPGLDQVNVQLPKYTLPAGKKTATWQIIAVSTGQVLRYEVDSF